MAKPAASTAAIESSAAKKALLEKWRAQKVDINDPAYQEQQAARMAAAEAQAAREALRTEVKALELKSERLLMETLEALPSAPGTPPAVIVALEAAARAWPRPAPTSALERLAQTLS